MMDQQVGMQCEAGSSAATPVDFAGMRYITMRLLWDCNLRCIMCDHPHKAKSEMSVETANRVLDQLTHPVRLTFIGGEPCLWLMKHPEVLSRAIDDGHVVHLITNGILLPRLPRFIDAFRDRSVSIQFSIDGYRDSYEKVRKRSRWDDLVKSIRLVQAARREGGNRDAFVTVNYLLMRGTLDDLPQFIRFCAAEGIDAVSLTYAMIYDSMVRMGEIAEDDSVYFHQERTNDAVALAVQAAQETGISLCYPAPLGHGKAGGVRWCGSPKHSVAPGVSPVPNNGALACSKPWKELFVIQDGTIQPCCCGPQIGPVLGNMEQGLTGAWNGEMMGAVRSALAAGEFHSNCRCGINLSEVGRQEGVEHFFTRHREMKRRLELQTVQ